MKMQMCGMNHIWMCTARSRSVRMIPLFQSAKQKLCVYTVYIYIYVHPMVNLHSSTLPLYHRIDCSWFGKVEKCYKICIKYTPLRPPHVAWFHATPHEGPQRSPSHHVCKVVVRPAHVWLYLKEKSGSVLWNCNGLKHQLKDFAGHWLAVNSVKQNSF